MVNYQQNNYYHTKHSPTCQCQQRINNKIPCEMYYYYTEQVTIFVSTEKYKQNYASTTITATHTTYILYGKTTQLNNQHWSNITTPMSSHCVKFLLSIHCSTR